tara:strand:- start:149 stop:409 length:261 start_codon:yes stop_codon:yes gene_type:complete
VIRHLLGQPIFVGFQERSNVRKSDLFIIELSLQVVSFRELIGNIVVHLRDLVFGLLHFLADSELKTFNLLKILVDVLFLDLKLGGS